MNREINTTGIIIKKIKYRETSFIMDIITPDFGVISVMAKGVRKSKSKNTGLLELLNEVDLNLYKNPNSDWYIYKSTELINANLFNISHSVNILMQAAIEVIRQIIISVDDSKAVYDLLTSYLQYIKSVNENGIAIYWRFLLKLYKILGIEFNIKHCAVCSQQSQLIGYFPQKHGFICKGCYHPTNEEQIFKFNDQTANLLSILNEIGNHIEDIMIPKTTILQLNNIFLTHISEHFHKKIQVKSLKLLKI